MVLTIILKYFVITCSSVTSFTPHVPKLTCACMNNHSGMSRHSIFNGPNHNLLFLSVGVSQRAKRKLARSGSASSNEYSQDDSSSPATAPRSAGGQSTDSPSGQRKQPPSRPPPPKANENKPKTGNFFETLEWQEEGGSLLDNGEDGEIHEGHRNGEGKLFDADFGSEPQTVDLLNMGGDGGGAATSGMSLLDMGGPEPTTLELLTGDTMNSTSAGGGQSANLLDDFFGGGAPPAQPQPPAAPQNQPNTFDPFQSLGGGSPKPPRPSQPPKTAPAAKKADAFDLFDPFQDLTTTTNNSSASQNKPNNLNSNSNTGGGGGVDLMGGWNSSSLSANNATSPGFIGSAGGAPMGMGGVPQRTTPSPMSGPPPKANDPFGDLGK